LPGCTHAVSVNWPWGISTVTAGWRILLQTWTGVRGSDQRGQHPLELPDGTQRKFLADGDAVVINALCEKPGMPRIGFGECRGVILPA
jgi:hypothetical protein